MKGKRYTEGQIAFALRQAASGVPAVSPAYPKTNACTLPNTAPYVSKQKTKVFLCSVSLQTQI